MNESPDTGPEGEESNLILVVVGAQLRAELGDRPLAYHLCDRIRDWLRKHNNVMNVSLAPVVCSDIWYLNQQPLQRLPTISLGGPGVNALSAFYANTLSPALVHDNHMVIQLDPEYVDLRVCIWGKTMN